MKTVWMIALAFALSGCLGSGDGAQLLSSTDVDVKEAIALATDAEPSAEPEETPAKRGGIFGLFQRKAPDLDAAAAEPVKTASAGGGLFGLFGSKTVDQIEEDAAGQLAFGRLAKVCRLKNRDRGIEVQRGGGFILYDTAPDTLAPRTFFVTGFKDRCARKVTAAIAFLGDPVLHEVRQYSRKAGYNDIDNAYEVIKAKICGTKRGRYCEKNTDRLQATTAFLSVYEYFGAPRAAGNALLHQGQVTQTDLAP